MQAYKYEVTVEEDGSVCVKQLPLRVGQKAEVIVIPMEEKAEPEVRYPLRGSTPYEYIQPTEPVAEGDWEAAGGSS